MNLYYLVLFMAFRTNAVDIGIDGEVVFKLKTPEDSEDLDQEPDVTNGKGKRFQVIKYYESLPVSAENRVVEKNDSSSHKMTVGPMVECLYQYPEEPQVQAILSNMMNELTKVFMRAQDMIKEHFRRKGETRFLVVNGKNTSFFEHIYSNMTREYLSFYNATTGRVYRSGRDPCQHQGEVKQLWEDLLSNSLTTFRRAAYQCIEEHLSVQHRSGDEKARAKLAQFLIREMSKVRMNQLVLLCDKFQLCFNDLIQ